MKEVPASPISAMFKMCDHMTSSLHSNLVNSQSQICWSQDVYNTSVWSRLNSTIIILFEYTMRSISFICHSFAHSTHPDQRQSHGIQWHNNTNYTYPHIHTNTSRLKNHRAVTDVYYKHAVGRDYQLATEHLCCYVLYIITDQSRFWVGRCAKERFCEIGFYIVWYEVFG